jgi:multiple sugar transport system substrate-binding protein
VQLSSDVELPTLAAEGALANLTTLGVSTAGEAPTVTALGTYKGTLYGLPSNIENYAIFYDKDAFAKAGITAPPATFAEFVSDAAKLTSGTEHGVALSGLSGDGSVAAYFLPWILSAGGNPSDPTSPGTIAAVNLYKQLVDNGSLSKEFVDWGWTSTDQWTAGKAAITVDGPWDIVNSSLKIHYATAPFPTLKVGQKPRVGLLGFEYGVSSAADSKQQKAAAALIQCRTSEANQVATAIAGGYVPALTAAQKAFVAKVPAAKSFVDAVPTAYNPATIGTKWTTLENEYAVALQNVGTNGVSARQALKLAVQANGQ